MEPSESRGARRTASRRRAASAARVAARTLRACAARTHVSVRAAIGGGPARGISRGLRGCVLCRRRLARRAALAVRNAAPGRTCGRLQGRIPAPRQWVLVVKMPPAVLVTDGDQRSALAVVRSLGAAGYPVYVCSSHRRSLAGASRYALGEAMVADSLENPEGAAADIRALIERWRIGALIPIGDASLLATLPDRSRLPNVV